MNTGVGNLIIVLAGAIPGYWVSVATVDTIGRKPIQLGGFIILTILFCIMGFAYHKLSGHGLLALYVLAQFVSVTLHPFPPFDLLPHLFTLTRDDQYADSSL